MGEGVMLILWNLAIYLIILVVLLMMMMKGNLSLFERKKRDEQKEKGEILVV